MIAERNPVSMASDRLVAAVLSLPIAVICYCQRTELFVTELINMLYEVSILVSIHFTRIWFLLINF